MLSQNIQGVYEVLTSKSVRSRWALCMVSITHKRSHHEEKRAFYGNKFDSKILR